MKPQSIIYCRVSSQRQVTDGHGLDSQEKRCRDFAIGKGYEVVKVFHDEGISGGLFERPAMHNLIAYLDQNKSKQFVIIFDDLARLARDVKIHIQLKAELVSRGCTLECLNFNFDKSEESEYAELILAAGNQYQRKQNRRQVIQKQKARLENGYWSFCNPPGLKFVKDPMHGKLLICADPLSSIYKEAIEKYADNTLNTLKEVTSFILEQYAIHRVNRKLSFNGAFRILTNVLYSGYIEYPPWSVSLRKGQHTGFISITTFNTVQEKLLGKSKPPRRIDYSLDFPLRSFLLCDKCSKPMTGGFTKGRPKKYPYYWCKTKGCSEKNKVAPSKKVNSEFENELRQVKISGEVLELAQVILNNIWLKKVDEYSKVQGILKNNAVAVENKVKNLLERISTIKDDNLVSLYEKQLIDLDHELKVIKAKESERKYTPEEFRTATKTVLSALKNPVMMWQTDNIESKRTIVFMYFDGKMIYNRKEGFRTATLACPIELIASLGDQKNNLVEMPGIGPGSGETLL